jgi:hypothetical protein
MPLARRHLVRSIALFLLLLSIAVGGPALARPPKLSKYSAPSKSIPKYSKHSPPKYHKQSISKYQKKR